MLHLLTILLFSLLAFGCARPPEAELRAAQAALAQAYASGAPELAPFEYQAANAALLNAQKLIRQGHNDPARELLPFAAEQASLATDKALAEKARLEQERQASIRTTDDQRHEATQPKPPPKSSKPKPTPKPAPPKLLDQYTLEADETLWDIAGRADIYSDPLLWPLLYKANRDQIKDPRKVFSGQVLTIPRELTSDELQAIRKEARESNLFTLPNANQQGLEQAK